ncbi:hypothetical protein VAR608DRAFT_4096 [Variovorax sp. HW608]|uniref:hypothetical protein n=1 Tax=Variovorax sp. HW608 TaxID=1034889 RepID=UPI000820116B|nr:hypothetical protein [Variovorax sp. HW608]SCK42702.1 hypothetical protein VAR608DRAFT_4096 [Variovorax sp. HW608]
MTDLRTGVVTDAQLLALQKGRSAAVEWLRSHVGADGKPVGAESTNRWWRLPWALSIAGDSVTAASVLAWAEHNAFDEQYDLRPGPMEFAPGASPIYELSALAIAAWRLGRYDLANCLLDRCATFQSQVTGGVYDRRKRVNTEQDVLKTAQLGLAAIVANRRDIADPIYGWFVRLWAAQPELPKVLYPVMDDNGELTKPSGDDFPSQFKYKVDLSAPLQPYYNPAIAAAFLYDYGSLTRESAAIALARQYLQLNIDGTEAQYNDRRSVQICKFAWGVANGILVDRASDLTIHAIRMGEWFLERQNADGSWTPASFGRAVEPTETDKLWKTGEHVMELTMILCALQHKINQRGNEPIN